mgnify:CR=1 FL=1
MNTTITFWDVFLSALRWLIGLAFGVTTGTLLSIINYQMGKWSTSFIFLRDFLRAIPIIGLVPVIQMTIGYGEIGKFLLIAWATAFPVWISVDSALKRKSNELELILTSYQLTRFGYYKHYIFPRLFAGFFSGVEVSIGIGWLSVVAAEFIGIYQDGFWAGGLGYLIMDANNLNNWNDVILGLGIFGVLGMVTARLWNLLYNSLFSSKTGFNPMNWIRGG